MSTLPVMSAGSQTPETPILGGTEPHAFHSTQALVSMADIGNKQVEKEEGTKYESMERISNILTNKNEVYNVDLEKAKGQIKNVKRTEKELKASLKQINKTQFKSIHNYEQEVSLHIQMRDRVSLFAQYMVIELIEFAL